MADSAGPNPGRSSPTTVSGASAVTPSSRGSPADRRARDERMASAPAMTVAPRVPAAMADAAREIGNYSLYDYVLVNSDLNLAAETLKSIVRAERVKRVRVEEKIRPILETFGQALGV